MPKITDMLIARTEVDIALVRIQLTFAIAITINFKDLRQNKFYVITLATF